jgi:hypothetical protein
VSDRNMSLGSTAFQGVGQRPGDLTAILR